MNKKTKEIDDLKKELSRMESSNKANWEKFKMQVKRTEEKIIIIQYLENKIIILQEELEKATLE